MFFEYAKIGEGTGQFEVGGSGGGHGEVNAEDAGGEDKEDGDDGGKFPRVEREPLQFGLLSGGRIVLQRCFPVLFIPQHRHVPRRRHLRRHGGWDLIQSPR